MKAIMQKAKEWLGFRQDMSVSPDVEAEFLLFLGDLLVGELTVADGEWQFEYSEDFRKSEALRPIVEFPDVYRTYKNGELWQFFASRIPSTMQPDVEAVLEKEKIGEDDVIALLKRFGKRTITSPFELKYKLAA
jgi:HipA-like protein